MKTMIVKIGNVEFNVNCIDGKISTISTDHVEDLTYNNTTTIKNIFISLYGYIQII